MQALEFCRSNEIRSRLNHPIIDSDGHTLEYQPGFIESLKEVGGPRMVAQYEKNLDTMRAWYGSSEKERAERRILRPFWWASHTANTLDRVTAALPALRYERLDEMGIDFAVVYPTAGFRAGLIEDDELRGAACRALNNFHAALYGEFSDRMTPVAVIPMYTPKEAVEELERVVNRLGMKAVVMSAYVLRPRKDGHGTWYDTLCLDSEYDYDPVWQKCLELKVAPTFHSNNVGIGTRMSISNSVYNHIGHFAASNEAICKAIFMSGVTRRYPDLRFAFLEGGVGWACSLFSDLIGHWKKRNRRAVERFNPANLDRNLFWELHRRYGGSMVQGKLDDKRNRELALYEAGFSFGGVTPTQENPLTLDEFAPCRISSPEDVRDLFIPNFYFGCEGDDPINAWAFDSKKNPFGARLRAIYGSDVGHWDVIDMRDAAAEAFELVEHGSMTGEDFRDFVFDNPVELWSHMNPDFFKGTVIEKQLSASIPSQSRP